MKILVIGASGVLAGPVIRKLDEAGFQLRLFSRSVNPSMFDRDYDIVRGDLFDRPDLEKAVEGCDAIYISVTAIDERKSTEAIVSAAKKKHIKLIGIVSGCTVSEENRWFRFVDNKFQAEQIIINSGIPYLIFRPTWFFETLEFMVRNGKAMVLGRQPNPYHWVAADDLGSMVANAYSWEEAQNGIYYIYGPEKYLMKELLEKYCRIMHPEIRKVSVLPIPILKIIGFLTGNSKLKYATALYSYFQKAREPEIPSEKLAALGKPETDFEKWVESKKQGNNIDKRG